MLGPVPSKNEESPLNRQYKLLLDKGLFDLDTTTGKNRDFCGKYWENAKKLLQPNGILLMATCSYTEEELKKNVGKGIHPLLFLSSNCLWCYLHFLFCFSFKASVFSARFRLQCLNSVERKATTSP